MELTGLPNIGTVLAENLRRVGITSAEELRAAGACEAWLRIRTQVDPGACFHQLTALAGAEVGLPKKELPPERKAELRAFFDRAKT
ncbi:TfoX/Sxy family DNA transformation protein [Dysosmobacter sp. Sow4_B12]|uniref:TfoX/Sxy family DNA transformation protein n=1 Tax=Dysosmobacter sp. Sow4_B12 TaxID=3438777 RepID=UPI003F933490